MSLTKTVLELGGSDPFIVLADADLPRAIATAVKARVVNNGQSCIAAKRFIVADAVYEAFAAGFVAAMAALRVGDPMDPATEVGPLASSAILETLADQVKLSVEAGARILTGGHRLEGPGNFYAPTVLADVPRRAPAFSEELFGPVAVLLRARDANEALSLANATPYGLGASALDAIEAAQLGDAPGDDERDGDGDGAAHDDRRHGAQQLRGGARLERADLVRRADEDLIDGRDAPEHRGRHEHLHHRAAEVDAEHVGGTPQREQRDGQPHRARQRERDDRHAEDRDGGEERAAGAARRRP